PNPCARLERWQPAASRRRTRQRQEDGRGRGHEVLFVELAAQRVAIAIGELLVNDNRVRWIAANPLECLRAIVRSVEHVPMWREDAGQRSAGPFVCAGDEHVDWARDGRS